MSPNLLAAAGLEIDRKRWLPIEATRCVVGVAASLLLIYLLKHPGAGILASVGALYTGLAASNGVYHARIRTMATNGFMIALATCLGTWVGKTDSAALIAVFLVAFVTSLYASAGRSASTIGAQTTAILCVVIGLKLPASGALQNGLLVLAGSATQLILLSLFWPMKPGVPEGRAVADAYHQLARFVLSLRESTDTDSPLIPPANAIQEARSLLNEAEDYPTYSEFYRLVEALRRAEALRAALVGFAQANREFVKRDRLSQVRSERILRTVARALQVIESRARAGQLNQPSVLLKVPAFEDDDPTAANYRMWLETIAELVESCGWDAKKQTVEPTVVEPIRVRAKSLFSALTKLPDREAVRSIVFQHAIRYAITVEIAFWISIHWTRSHSYWLPLTTAIVLRQDYGSTFYRGMARLMGTLLGLVVSIVIIDALHLGPVTVQVLILAMTWFAFASAQASYMLVTAAVTGSVVFGIAASGVVDGEISGMRLVASIVGILIALISYLFWPAWSWNQIWQTIKTAATAQREYVELVTSASPDSKRKRKEIDEARADARALRIQSEKLVEAAKLHPFGRSRSRIERAESALLALEENAAIILVSQTERRMGNPESDFRLREALNTANRIVVQVS